MIYFARLQFSVFLITIQPALNINTARPTYRLLTK